MVFFLLCFPLFFWILQIFLDKFFLCKFFNLLHVFLVLRFLLLFTFSFLLLQSYQASPQPPPRVLKRVRLDTSGQIAYSNNAKHCEKLLCRCNFLFNVRRFDICIQIFVSLKLSSFYLFEFFRRRVKVCPSLPVSLLNTQNI